MNYESTTISQTRYGVSMAKVFLYMFIGLFITAFVGGLLGWLFTEFLSPTMVNVYYGLQIGSSIVTIVVLLWIILGAMKSKHSLWVPYIIYAICMGVTFSSFCIYLDWTTLTIAFGITSLCFGSMALIGFFSKGNLNAFAIIGMGLLIGCLLLTGVNFLMWFLFPAVWTTLYWIITFVGFAAVMLITAYDVWSIRKIAEAGQMQSNIALFCAFRLYTDFIYILFRVLSVIALSRN